jgi:hypothetical protein
LLPISILFITVLNNPGLTAASLNERDSVYKGYYLMQGVNAYFISAFGAISTAAEADSLCHILKSHPLSGVEYGSLYYHPEDISANLTVAKVFQSQGIDLWLSSGGLMSKIRAFNNDTFPNHYRAYM